MIAFWVPKSKTLNSKSLVRVPQEGVLFILMARFNARFTFMIHGDIQADRLATDVTVLHIFLESNRAVDHHLDPLTAVWTNYLNGFQ